MNYNYAGNAKIVSGHITTCMADAMSPNIVRNTCPTTTTRENRHVLPMDKLSPAMQRMAGYIECPKKKRGRKRLTPEQVLSIRARYEEMNPQYGEVKAVLLRISEADGIGYNTVRDIVLRKTWVNI